MRGLFTIATKSVFALLALMTVGLMAFASYLAWHYAYGIGLPDNNRLAAVSATGPACSADPARTYVPLAEIPPLLRKTVILFEDPNYYERPSLNPFAEFALALVHDREPQPSNITNAVTRCLMSLAEGCCRGPSLDWHVGNIVLQNRVVRVLSRNRILEIFLNESYFGRDTYGVGAASMSYFGKPLELLRIDEIALLAVLARTPFLLRSDRGHEFSIKQRNAVIDKMQRAGFITDIEATNARARPTEFREIPSRPQNL